MDEHVVDRAEIETFCNEYFADHDIDDASQQIDKLEYEKDSVQKQYMEVRSKMCQNQKKEEASSNLPPPP
jgi:hypothetical protein